MRHLTLGMLLALVSCAHQNVQHKVAMELPFAPELVQEMQKDHGRMPASIELDSFEGKSSRRVYFSALYHQFLTLGQHLNQSQNLNSCPAFHHDKVEADSSFIPKVVLFNSSIVGTEDKQYFPELVFTKKFSLQDYYGGLEQEILTLCEEGYSDNYFKFDNLITHYAGKPSFHNRPDSMKSVLKIPVFANYYLLKMLQATHTLSFVHPEEKKVIEMTQTHWFEKYVSEAFRVRNNLIKNRMVQR